MTWPATRMPAVSADGSAARNRPAAFTTKAPVDQIQDLTDGGLRARRTRQNGVVYSWP